MSQQQPLRLDDHNINYDDLDQNALKVVDVLSEAGFDAYLVGGCVRDLLCGMKPKDFDVATNATPEQVRALFRRSRLIGRRFPIAHVRYGRDIIEVSTFRQAQHDDIETNEQGLIVRDQAFGDLAGDAFADARQPAECGGIARLDGSGDSADGLCQGLDRSPNAHALDRDEPGEERPVLRM